MTSVRNISLHRHLVRVVNYRRVSSFVRQSRREPSHGPVNVVMCTGTWYLVHVCTIRRLRRVLRVRSIFGKGNIPGQD